MTRICKMGMCFLIAMSLFYTSIIAVNADYVGRAYMFTYSSSSLPAYFHDNERYVLFGREVAERTLPWLWDMNYDAGEYLNNSVDPICDVMKTASILTVYTHGEPGRLYCPDPHTEYAPRMTTLSASYQDSSPTNYVRSVRLLADDLSNLDFVMFCACSSAASDSLHGSFLEMFEDKGVGCFMGWNNPIPAKAVYGSDTTDYTAIWVSYFFQACYFNHCTVKDAADTAKARMNMEFADVEKETQTRINDLSNFAFSNPLFVLYP